jgi:hypothetical protein
MMFPTFGMKMERLGDDDVEDNAQIVDSTSTPIDGTTLLVSDLKDVTLEGSGRTETKKVPKTDRMLLLQNSPEEKFAKHWTGRTNDNNFFCVHANSNCAFYQVDVPKELSPGDKFLVKGIKGVGFGRHKMTVVCVVPQHMREHHTCECGGSTERIVLVHSMLPYSTHSILEHEGFVTQGLRIEKLPCECCWLCLPLCPMCCIFCHAFSVQQQCERTVDARPCKIHLQSDPDNGLITVKARTWRRIKNMG